MKLKHIIFAGFALALIISWLAKHTTGFKLSLTGIAFSLVWLACHAAAEFFSRMRRRRELERMPVFSLGETALTMIEKGKAAKEKPLEELERVLLLTTDPGPFVCDVFLVLLFHDGTEWRIASENPGYADFYRVLSERLPLDSQQALQAMFSTDNAVFPLWKRSAETRS